MDIKDRPLVLPTLAAARAATAKRRATAFCDAPEYVFGIRVKPLTPATWSMLAATGSRFVKGETALEGDVRNYLWFHSPQYCDSTARFAKWRKSWALRRLTLAAAQPWRRWFRQKPDPARYYSVIATAIVQIEAIVNDAFADAPRAQGDAKPLATLEAILVGLFAREYRWSAEATRYAPLCRLFQLMRCIQSSKGNEPSDNDEQVLTHAHLVRRNAELQAQRQKEVSNGR